VCCLNGLRHRQPDADLSAGATAIVKTLGIG
jgi:hypothetical protein